MKKTILLTACLLALSTFLYAQKQQDTIEIKKVLMGHVFKQHGKPLKPIQLLQIMENTPEAYKEMKIAKKNIAVSNVLGGIGGFLFGYQLGSAVTGKSMNTGVFVTGVGLIGLSIPFGMAYLKHATKAVKLYNNYILQTPSPVKVNE